MLVLRHQRVRFLTPHPPMRHDRHRPILSNHQLCPNHRPLGFLLMRLARHMRHKPASALMEQLWVLEVEVDLPEQALAPHPRILPNRNHPHSLPTPLDPRRPTPAPTNSTRRSSSHRPILMPKLHRLRPTRFARHRLRLLPRLHSHL